jgi:hypothetical protein
LLNLGAWLQVGRREREQEQ